jgi:ribose 5-phosphate isomerase A
MFSRPAYVGIALSILINVSKVKTKCQEPLDVAIMKRTAGYQAVDAFITSGMTVGIGTGTTTVYAVDRIATKVNDGLLKDITVVPTSEDFAKLCVARHLTVRALNTNPEIDVMIDSANEIDEHLNILKGGTGAFLREKMVASASNRYVCIVDETKLVKSLGVRHPLPVEIAPYCAEYTRSAIEHLSSLEGCKAILRRGSVNSSFPDGFPLAVTDNGNFIVDVYFNEPIHDVIKVIHQLNALSGVIDHGLICNPATFDLHEVENFQPMPSLNILVGTKSGARLLGEQGEQVWWSNLPIPIPLERQTIDNRQIH